MSTERAFGRIYVPDARDARFPMRAHLPKTVEIVSRSWRVGPVLDQGRTPQCVGYSAKQFLQSDPIETLDGPTATELYEAARKNDEWEGEAYEGSSVRGAAKAMTGMGRLASYVWGSSAADVRDWVITQGPVIMGTDWRQGMMTPTRDGYVNVTGSLVGGHAWLIVGYEKEKNRFRMVNSWGKSWGQDGQAWVRFADLNRLISQDGEACSAVEQALSPTWDLPTCQREIEALKKRVAFLEDGS